MVFWVVTPCNLVHGFQRMHLLPRSMFHSFSFATHITLLLQICWEAPRVPCAAHTEIASLNATCRSEVGGARGRPETECVWQIAQLLSFCCGLRLFFYRTNIFYIFQFVYFFVLLINFYFFLCFTLVPCFDPFKFIFLTLSRLGSFKSRKYLTVCTSCFNTLRTLHSAHRVYLCVPYGSHNKQH
jgi:hypothetical protein